MRRDSSYLHAVLIGALFGGVVYAGVSQLWSASPPPPVSRPPEDSPTGRTHSEGGTAADRLAEARRLMAAGRLHEAQERYLEILLSAPRDERAMAGLVAVRRRLAGDDTAVLHQEAAWAWGAIKNVRADAAPQTARRLRLIAQASALAAQEIERERGRRPVVLAVRPPAARATATPRHPVRQTVKPTRPARSLATARARVGVTSAPKPQPVRTPTPVVRPSPRTTPRVRPSPRATERLASVRASPRPRLPEPEDDGSRFRVYIGPLGDEQSADRIARAVARAGYPAETIVVHDAPTFRFVVVSEPLTRQMLLNGVANRRARAMAARGFRPRLQLQAAGISRFKFGEFETEEEAEALARRIRRAGYRATVLREGGIYYQVAGGPLSQRGVNAVVDLIRARFRRVAVTVTRVD